MNSLPMRRGDFQLHSFLGFLVDSGAEIGKPSNQYEVIRYRFWHPEDKKQTTHIVYVKENGRLTFTGKTRAHYTSFMQGKEITSKTKESVKTGKKYPKSTITREALLKRDGGDCWFCGIAMGEDCTIEHLIPKSKGGRNIPENYALAHKSCNNQAANKPLVEKMKMREKLHKELS